MSPGQSTYLSLWIKATMETIVNRKTSPKVSTVPTSQEVGFICISTNWTAEPSSFGFSFLKKLSIL